MTTKKFVVISIVLIVSLALSIMPVSANLFLLIDVMQKSSEPDSGITGINGSEVKLLNRMTNKEIWEMIRRDMFLGSGKLNEIEKKAIISDIQNGVIKPLSQQMSSESRKPDFIIITDASGNELYTVNLDTYTVNLPDTDVNEATDDDNCPHDYWFAEGVMHFPNSDGSCTYEVWDIVVCKMCGQIWFLDLISSAYFRVCPHDGE